MRKAKCWIGSKVTILDGVKIGKNSGNLAVNGTSMFIYQALYAFKLWHNLTPKINEEVIRLLDND